MIEDEKNNPLIEFSDQIRAVEALLFAASDPLDEKTLKDMLPVDTNIEEIMNNLLSLYKGRGVELKKVTIKGCLKLESTYPLLSRKEAKFKKNY